MARAGTEGLDRWSVTGMALLLFIALLALLALLCLVSARNSPAASML
jgi:hypothetical protein